MTFGRGLHASMLDKRIPTLVGLGVLIVGLVVGVLLLGQGTNVFAPRATPETTPKQIRVTNVSDTSFTVSFATNEKTAGFLKYGTDDRRVTTQAPDDRDKLTGSVADYTLHHITVTGLQPGTQYYYLLGTGNGTTFDNEGAPFSIKTAARGGTPAAAKTAYGSVSNENGSPADGAIVYLKVEGAGDLSTLVKSSGSWAVPLSSARTKDGSAYAQITDATTLTVEVKGSDPRQQIQYQTTVTNTQPVAALQFGKNPGTEGMNSAVETEDTETIAQATEIQDPVDSSGSTAMARGGVRSLLDDDSTTSDSSTADTTKSASATPSATVVDLSLTEQPVITTTTPVITGVVPPNVTIDIEVHSETQITQQLIANPDGTFSLNIEELGKSLEPGEHTVTYSYTDPTSGQKVTKTQTFTVAPHDDVQQLAQADNSGRSATASPTPSPTPFGSGNPYPVGGTATQSATKSATASDSATATKSATPSGRASMPSTASGIPVSGSVGTTTALVIGGLFFLIAGAWSFWMSKELE